MQWPQFQHGFLNSNSKMCFFSPLIPAFKRQHNHCTGVSDSAVCLRALAAADRGGQQTSGLNTLSSVFVFLASLLPDAVKRSSLNLAPRLRLMNSLLQRCARHTLLRRYDIKVHLTKPWWSYRDYLLLLKAPSTLELLHCVGTLSENSRGTSTSD